MPYYDDDGTEIDMASIPLPDLCRCCENNTDPNEEILCNLTRLDQRNDPEFRCYAFRSLYGPLIDDIIL